MKPVGLLKSGGRVPKSFFFEKKESFFFFQIKPCLFSKCFSKHSVNTLVKFFLFYVMQTFLNSKMPRNSLEEKLCS